MFCRIAALNNFAKFLKHYLWKRILWLKLVINLKRTLLQIFSWTFHESFPITLNFPSKGRKIYPEFGNFFHKRKNKDSKKTHNEQGEIQDSIWTSVDHWASRSDAVMRTLQMGRVLWVLPQGWSLLFQDQIHLGPFFTSLLSLFLGLHSDFVNKNNKKKQTKKAKKTALQNNGYYYFNRLFCFYFH